MASSKKGRKAVREEVRGKRDEIREVVRSGKRVVTFVGQVGTAKRIKAGLLGVFLVAVLGCNTATPASKSASSKACDNVTTVNNHFGLVVIPTNGGPPIVVGLAGPVTVNVSDVNGTIAQSADTEGGDATDLTAAPSMNAGLTGDAPVKAVADAVSAFASPAGAADATLKALVKKFGLESATNAVAGAVGSACADGSCEVRP